MLEAGRILIGLNCLRPGWLHTCNFSSHRIDKGARQSCICMGAEGAPHCFAQPSEQVHAACNCPACSNACLRLMKLAEAVSTLQHLPQLGDLLLFLQVEIHVICQHPVCWCKSHIGYQLWTGAVSLVQAVLLKL